MSKKKINITLPNKLSDLIDVAVADMRAVKKDKRYELEGWQWHTAAIDEDKCQVCMAGAVLARESGVGPDETININTHVTLATIAKLHTLNLVRVGAIHSALKCLSPRRLRSPEQSPEQIAAVDAIETCARSWFDTEERRGLLSTSRYSQIARALRKVGL